MTTYDYRDISPDGRSRIADLSECDGFPDVDLRALTEADLDELAAYLRCGDDRCSDYDAEVADELDALVED